MENDTIKKIDEAIDSIQKQDSDKTLDKVEVKKDLSQKDRMLFIFHNLV